MLIYGGDQLRPNINIRDMVRAYLCLINAPSNLVNNQVFNAGYENNSVSELGLIIKNIIGNDVSLNVEKTDDNRSYHINSNKIYDVLNFKPQFTIENAVETLVDAFNKELLINTFNESRYYNIKLMKENNLA